MKKLSIIVLLLVLISIVYAQNETLNETSTNMTSNQTQWYQSYLDKATASDNMTIISVIIGLLLVYLLGKLAFKLIKWAVIILAIILLIKMVI